MKIATALAAGLMASLVLAGVSTALEPAPTALNPDQRALLLETVRRAPLEGLAPVRLADDADDEALERAVIGYAEAMRGGRMAGRFPRNWAIRPAAYDAATAYRAALARDGLEGWLAELAPPHEAYAALRAEHVRYRAIAALGGWTALDKGPALKPGAKSPRIAQLRRRIALETGIEASSEEPDVFDEALAELLKAEQARLGVPVTGELDKATAAAFNIPAAERAATIAANLERWRWMPRGLPGYRVEVNVAGADLRVVRGTQVPLTMRIIVGRPKDPTPMFADEIEGAVFNPPWNVPAGIAANEIWPKAKADPGYLAAHDYIVKPDGGLQQKAGPKAALGLVKFDLPNPFTVYLHDTPSRGLFARHVRTLSHGCMRLEKPRELAKLLFEGDPAWTAGVIDAVIASGATRHARLRQAVPVLVLYRTAYVEGGQVNFRPDVYDWDRTQARLTGK